MDERALGDQLLTRSRVPGKSGGTRWPLTYTWSDVDIIDDTVESIYVSPRFGVTGDVGDMGLLAVFIGANYLDADMDITGSIAFDTSGVPGLGSSTSVDYSIRQSNKDRWNYLIGFNWDVTRSWSVQAEIGSGGSRDNIIGSLTYRF